jgi:hypothetical protein
LDQSLDQTWPFILSERLRSEYGIPVYPCLRGLGGASIIEVKRMLIRDSGYFRGGKPESLSFIIFNVGIVDAAPRPFTYFLRGMSVIPKIGPVLWQGVERLLRPHKMAFHKIYSYNKVGPLRFGRNFDWIIRMALNMQMIPISIDTPLTPESFEERTPGLRRSILKYNALKNARSSALHIPTDWVGEEHLREDGHHFNAVAHHELAERLASAIIGRCSPSTVREAGYGQ